MPIPFACGMALQPGLFADARQKKIAARNRRAAVHERHRQMTSRSINESKNALARLSSSSRQLVPTAGPTKEISLLHILQCHGLLQVNARVFSVAG
jgi:hypothetical protein